MTTLMNDPTKAHIVTEKPVRKLSRWRVLPAFIGGVLCVAAVVPSAASAAAVAKGPVAQNGALNALYARVDAVGKNTVTVTPISGVNAQGIGAMIAGGQIVADSRELRGTSLAALSTALQGKVVSFSGYVTDDSYTKKDTVQQGQVCGANNVCLPVYKDVSSRVNKYTLHLTYLSVFPSSVCLTSSKQRIDVPWSARGTDFTVQICKVDNVSLVYVPRSGDYTVLEVKVGKLALPVKPGLWVSTTNSFTGKVLTVTYDITNDGKPPVVGKQLSL